MKMYSPHKNDSHLILVDYGDNQLTLRIQDKGNTVTCFFILLSLFFIHMSLLILFSLQSVSSF